MMKRINLFLFVYCYIHINLLVMCDCTDLATMDITTPRNAFLSGFYKRSFAYFTIKERLPKILTQSIDILVRNKDEIVKEYGNDSKQELKDVIGELSKLKYEIQTNKLMRNITSSATDTKVYNNFLAMQMNNTFFSAVWLHAECYMYRRIHEIFELTQHLQLYDLFHIQKEESFNTSLVAISQLSMYLSSFNETDETHNLKEEFMKLLKLNLWGNQCDLSFSTGVVEECANWIQTLDSLQSNIVSDQSEEIWLAVSDTNASSNTIDFVLDNAGYELFTDMCLADFLISRKFAQTIHFYVKNIPWFVSDVTKHDFEWTLQQLVKSDEKEISKLGHRWTRYIKKDIWKVVQNDFFTLPHDYSFMGKEAPSLYKQLANAKLIFFKGDLNYRKLLGEKNWDPSTPFKVAVQGFGPSKIATLRTIKCQLICGLEPGAADALTAKDSDWLINGKYGVIQFCDDIQTLD